MCYFVFFKQKTGYEMRISEWSSDVCSSDLQCDERYAAQVNLRPNALPRFLEGTGLHLNRNLADLLRREPSPRASEAASLTVIDVKATRRATAFHKTQVAFYVRVLEELLREHKLTSSEVTTINPFGEIWRIPDEGTAEGDDWQIEQFALAPYLRLVDEFCRESLPGIASKRVGSGIDETFFRSEEHTSELQSLMRISYAVFCLKKKTQQKP